MTKAADTIGVTIRDLRARKGLSQGDIEERTGLLRCYLSRVENGHTVPETLEKIASALETPLCEFFPPLHGADALRAETPELSEEEIAFLRQVQRYTDELDAGDRRILLAIIRKFVSQEKRA